MADILTYWGIYPDVINDVVERCEDALVKAGYRPTEINNWHENVKDNAVLDNDNLTNSILLEYLHGAVEMLNAKGYEANYYVNCSDTHLYINNEEFYEGDDLPELGEEKIEYYTKVLCDMIENLDFELAEQEDGMFCLIDTLGAYLGGTESYRDFQYAEGIIYRFSSFMDDYYYDDLKEAAQNYGIDTSADYNELYEAEKWVRIMDEHEDFKKYYFHAYEVMKLICLPSEIINKINLSDVAHSFDKERAKNKGAEKNERNTLD